MVLEPLAVPPAGHLEEEDAAPAVELFVRLALAAGAGWDVDHAARRRGRAGALARRAAARHRAGRRPHAGAHPRRPAAPVRPAARPAVAAVGRRPHRHTSCGRHRHQLRAAARRPAAPAPAHGGLPRPGRPRPGPAGGGRAGTDVVEVVDDLSQLVDRSLVVADHSAGVARYRLYDSIRAYAGEQLDAAGERDAVRDRYVDELAAVADEFVVDALEQWTPELIADIVDRVTHLTTAIEWSLDDPTPARAYRLVIPLYGPTHGSHAATTAALARQVTEPLGRPRHAAAGRGPGRRVDGHAAVGRPRRGRRARPRGLGRPARPPRWPG